MTTNTDTNISEYVASVWTPHGEAIGEKYITAHSDIDALGAATIWADNEYCEPYAMNCTIVIAEAITGKVVGWWLGEGNVIPSIITDRTI